MQKRVFAVFILIICLFTFTGCDSFSGIDKYYFIVSLGIDEGDNGLLKISIQASSTSSQDSSGSSSSSQSSNYKIYTVEAETVNEGFTILNNYLDKRLNLSHCSALVISEALAKKGIHSIFNTLSNNTELRNTCNLIISSGTALELLEKVSNSGEAFSSRLFDYLVTTTEYTGFTIKSTVGTFYKNIHSKNNCPTAIYTILSDEAIQTAGIAIFKDDCMIGHIDELSSIAHLILTNNLKNCNLTFANPFEENTKIDLAINLYKKTNIAFSILNNSPYISVSVYPECIVKNSGNNFNYINEQNIKILEEVTNKYITELLQDYLYDITKKYNSDIVGFSNLYKSQFLTEEDFDKIHWNEIFKDSFYDIKINTRINSSSLFNKE